MMPAKFDATYNLLKKRSFDLAIRISELEESLGSGNSRIIRLKKSFSKLQSAVNFAMYYKNNRMMDEANTHIDYALKQSDFLYTAVEAVQVPTSKIELLNIDSNSKKEKPRKKKTGIKLTKQGFKLRLSRRNLLLLVLIGFAYVFFMWWFFLR